MATSVKILEEDKVRLEHLQTRFSTIVGRKLTLQEVLGLLIRKARIPLDELAPPMKPATPEQMERLLSHRIEGKKRYDSSTIDRELYGWKEE